MYKASDFQLAIKASSQALAVVRKRFKYFYQEAIVFSTAFIRFFSFLIGEENWTMRIFRYCRILATLSVPQCQRYRTDEAARHIRNEVRPSRLSTWKIQLMPLIEQSNQQRAEKRNSQTAPSMESASEAKCPCEQRKHDAMKQFIPWFRHQIHSNRLCSSKEQASHDPKCQQYGCGTKMAG